MAESRDNSGLLGINDRKEKDSHPDHKGSCTIEGVEYWVSGWDKENRYGPFISLSFTRKDEKPSHQKGTVPITNRSAPQKATPKPVEDFTDDVPF